MKSSPGIDTGDRIRAGKDTGYGRCPCRHFQIKAVWLELALSAADLIAWAQTMLLNGDLATAGLGSCATSSMHTAARITRGLRRTWIRIDRTWPWASDLAAAFTGPALLPAPT